MRCQSVRVGIPGTLINGRLLKTTIWSPSARTAPPGGPIPWLSDRFLLRSTPACGNPQRAWRGGRDPGDSEGQGKTCPTDGTTN